jgi:Uma2 family endonuclease
VIGKGDTCVNVRTGNTQELSQMTISKSYPCFTPEEYLEIEESSTIKHEYIQGHIYAMAGASKAHVILTGNLVTLLNNHLRGTGCIVYSTDMKVRIEVANTFYYPDVTVTCDERDRTSSEDFIRYPRLIIEVLSRKTESFDRGDKFADYKTIETLEEYILVNQYQMSVERFQRNAEGLWVPFAYRESDEVSFANVNFHQPIAELYENVALLT